MTKPIRFSENINRDIILLKAALAGDLDAIRLAAMLMPDFVGGPDVVTSYFIWMSQPERRSYRKKVAAALKERS